MIDLEIDAMWALYQRGCLRCGVWLLAATLVSSCVHLDPPTRATAEQESERQSESPTSSMTLRRAAGRSPEPCTINFDDPDALGRIFDQARITFVAETGRSASGELELCDSRVHDDCWAYRQRCTRNDVNVEAIDYVHFHLMMERGTLCYGLPDPGDGHGAGFGRMVDGACAAVDWANTPRLLASHRNEQWIKVWVGDARTQTPTHFDLEAVWVLPDTPIQLWFRKRDGTWWFWPILEAAGVWDVADWVRNVSEVRIRGTDSSAGAYAIGAFVIRD